MSPTHLAGQSITVANRTKATMVGKTHLSLYVCDKTCIAGTDLTTVRDLLGHADIKTMMSYAHAIPASKRKAINLP
jgi:hypothetical protein